VDVVETVQPYQREVMDKHGRWHSLRVRPYRTLDNRIDGAVIVLVDIDSVKATAESLRAGAERLTIMYDRAPLGIFETDLDGRFLRVNDAFTELTGRSRETLLALRSQDITHPDDLAADWEAFEQIRTGAIPSVRRDKRYVREDGHAVWVELHRFAVDQRERLADLSTLLSPAQRELLAPLSELLLTLQVRAERLLDGTSALTTAPRTTGTATPGSSGACFRCLPDRSKRSAMCRCASPPASTWRLRGLRDVGNRRCCSCSVAWTRQRADRCRSKDATSAASARSSARAFGSCASDSCFSGSSCSRC